MIRVLIVDDQELVRAGLRGILRERYGFDIVGECADGSGVAAAVVRLQPDVVLMDVRMPVVDGVAATKAIGRVTDPPPVLVLTTFDDDEILAAALRAGASGFLLKGVPADDLQRAVRTVAEGGAWLGPRRWVAAATSPCAECGGARIGAAPTRMRARRAEPLRRWQRCASRSCPRGPRRRQRGPW